MHKKSESPSLLRQILSSFAIVLMLIGVLSIPFVSTEIAIGTGLLSGFLYLLIKILNS